MSTENLLKGLTEQAKSGVLIQGEQYSFHDRALSKILPEARSIPVRSFPELSLKLTLDDQQLGLMAIENSVAGALLTNYLLIEEHHLTILGETYLRISHAVLGTQGSSLETLKSIQSHPMALNQCRAFFRDHPHIRPIEAYDTAGSAEEVARAGKKNLAAIAPIWCAEPNGLQVLAKAVEDNPHNWTRFVLVAHANSPLGGNKTSIAFSVTHESGSLVKALNAIAQSGSSMTKIQSLPLVGEPWKYRFFVDFLHEPTDHPKQMLEQINIYTHDLIHLGTYQAGQHFES